MKNPFELVTASKLSASNAVDLWCDDKRLARVIGRENCFVNGHRGTGKTMLFRVLQYDCQRLLNPNTTTDFLAVYFPVRDTEFLTEEFELFQDDAQRNIISESHFSLLIVKQLVLLLKGDPSIITETDSEGLIEAIIQSFEVAFQYSTEKFSAIERNNVSDMFSQIATILERERIRIVNYIGLRLYDRTPFDGPLFLFDTLLGVIGDYFAEHFNRCLYILVDDGDDLPESHTIVLNSWIARRRASIVFKVSTMFGYKTYETRSRSAIQHPHDFFQYDIATRYMADATEDYVELLREICEKRLRNTGIETSPGKADPDEFFPEHSEQRKRLNELAAKMEVDYSEKFKGRAIKDYVYRHLTSEYIQDLAKRHSPNTFNYSGFKTLAILSSGLVRDFIICAQRMYDNASRKNLSVNKIPPSVQNTIVREHADMVLEEILNPKQKRVRNTIKNDWQKIYRLIEGLGTLFKHKMLSKDSERRVFSFAFQNEPGEKIERLLELAVAEGYLMKGFMSKKEGTGRRTLFVLTRRLAPAFNLDVTAYSGYLSLTRGRIEDLINQGPPRLSEKGVDNEEFPLFESLESPKKDGGSEGDWVMISPEEAGF